MASSPGTGALDRARAKAYVRLLPILLASYVIAYVDRINVGFAKLTMQPDLAASGVLRGGIRLRHGDILRRLPGAGDPRHAAGRAVECPEVDQPDHDLLGDRGGADGVRPLSRAGGNVVGGAGRCVGWPISSSRWPIPIWAGWPGSHAKSLHALRAPGSPFVLQFFSVRFLLGLAEAGFYPGVIVYLTHWFPEPRPHQDAGVVLHRHAAGGDHRPADLGTDHDDRRSTATRRFWGMVGWQWVFIFWGIPAVILGILVLVYLDRPALAGALADRRRTNRARGNPGPRETRAETARRAHDHPPGPGQPQGAGSGGSLLLRGHGKLRRRILHGVDS